MTVRVAIIGAGVMGADHASILSQDVPGVCLQVVCDVSDAAAREVAEANGAEDSSTDPEATIRRADVDAVIIASPDPTHADLTLAALRLRTPVLCEKPLAVTAKDCLSVVNAECEIGHRLVHVGFMRRFDPSYVEMKAALQSERIGGAVMMHNFHRNVSAPSSFSGSMAITNSAPHEFDAARYVLNTEIIAISAFEPAAENPGVCQPVVMVLETLKGQIVTVEVNNNANYGYDVRAELVGTEGSVSLASQPHLRIDKDLVSGTSYGADWRARFREAYRQQNKAWVKAIETGVHSKTAANAWDGYRATVIAEAGVAALSSGQKVKINRADRPSLYDESGAAA